MFTIPAIILRILSNSCSNVFQKKLTAQGMPSLTVNFLTYAGLSIVCIVLFPTLHPAVLTIKTWEYALTGGLLGALGNGFLIKALEKGELSLLGPINSYKAVAAMAAGIIFAGEIPSPAGIFATALIIFGSYFIFNSTEEGFSLKLLKRKDIQYRILALIFTAAEAVFIKKIIVLSDIKTAFVLWCVFGTIFSFFLLKVKKIKIEIPAKKTSFLVLFLIISTGLMQYTTNYVFKNMNVSYALALFQLSTILSVILGWKYFNETDLKKKLLGSAIMVAGAVILILL